MSHLAGIPVPSIEQIIVGAQLIIILYPVRVFMHWIDNEARRERNHIIRAHVKSGHLSRLKHCFEGDCPSLRKPLLVRRQP